MHNAALSALGMEGWRYQRLPVPPALFEETVRALGPAGFLGANVTIPHKHAALALATRASPAAVQIGAANTLTFAADGTISAENTDGPGLIAALEQLAGMPAHPRALVLGAGGRRERGVGLEPHSRARRGACTRARRASRAGARSGRPARQLHLRGPRHGRLCRTLGY
jgi:shikimate dehydrogenase